MLYKTNPKTVPQVAQELGVGLIVEGSVARSGDRIRITAQVIDADRDEHIWARTYDRTTRDVLGLQAEVAAAIVGEVKGVAAARRSRLRADEAVNPAAYDMYLRGRHAWNERSPQGLADAARYFDEAIRRIPVSRSLMPASPMSISCPAARRWLRMRRRRPAHRRSALSSWTSVWRRRRQSRDARDVERRLCP
jgi:hypothetical protein